MHTVIGCDYTSKVETKHAALNANPSKYLTIFDSGPSCTDISQHPVRHTWYKC